MNWGRMWDVWDVLLREKKGKGWVVRVRRGDVMRELDVRVLWDVEREDDV